MPPKTKVTIDPGKTARLASLPMEYIRNNFGEEYDAIGTENYNMMRICEIFDREKDTYPDTELDPDTKNEITAYAKNNAPEGIVPSDKRAQRRELHDRFMQKNWELRLRSELAFRKLTIPSRGYYAFLDAELSERAEIKNRRFLRIMQSGTPEQKKEEVARRLIEFGKKDYSVFDFADDKSFVDNYETIHELTLITDQQNILKVANEVGLDLTEPRFRQFCEKEPVFAAAWWWIGMKEKLLGSPAYEHFDFEKFPENGKFGFEDEVDCTSIVSDGYATFCDGMFAKEDVARMCIFDKTVPLDQRLENTKKTALENSDIYKASREAALAHPELTYTAPAAGTDGYFDTCLDRISSELAETDIADVRRDNASDILKLVVLNRMRNEYAALSAAGNTPDREEFYRLFSRTRISERADALALEPGALDYAKTLSTDDYELLCQGDAAALDRADAAIKRNIDETARRINEDPHGYFKAKITENVNEIKKFVPDFEMTDAEIEEMITPERLARQALASSTLKRQAQLKCDVTYIAGSNVNPMFSRISFLLCNQLDTPEANAENAEMLRKLAENSPEADEYRSQKLAEALNRANSVRPDDLRGKTDDEIFDSFIGRYQDAVMAFDIKNIMDTKNSGGLSLNAEASEKFDKSATYIAGLGGIAVKVIKSYGDEETFTFPNHKLNANIAQKLLLKGNDKLKTLAVKYFSNTDSTGVLDKLLAEEDKSGQEYSAADVEITKSAEEKAVATLDGLRRVYADYARELKKADHFYNFRNSEEYTNVLTALENADKVFGKMSGQPVTGEKCQAVYDAVKSVYTAANAYNSAKQGDTDATRTQRRNICSKIMGVTKFVSDLKNPNIAGGGYELDREFRRFMSQTNSVLEREFDTAAQNYRNEVAQSAENPGQAEKLYRLGLENTEAQRLKINALHHGTDGRKAQIKAVKARDELTNFIGRDKIDVNKARALIATVLVCDGIVRTNADTRSMEHADIDRKIKDFYENKDFVRMTKSITSDCINAFLTKDGEKRLADRFAPVLNPEQPKAEINAPAEDAASLS